MSQTAEPSISVRVDLSNPGQFFACCGLFEFADRLWKGAEGWFQEKTFHCRPLNAPEGGERTLRGLLHAVAQVSPQAVVPEDEYSSPIDIPAPFELRLDWWKDDRAGGDRLKAWAGSMRGFRIASAMQSMLSREELQTAALLDYAAVVYDPVEPDNKVEPFYFDARRGSNARPIDIGFSPDALKMESLAYPAVEFLCLAGIQRFRPLATERPRVFNYYAWAIPLATRIAPLAACGVLTHAGLRGFRFENAFRTDQRKHKAFTTATALGREDDDRFEKV
jgi:CRISPR-associated protein Csx14